MNQLQLNFTWAHDQFVVTAKEFPFIQNAGLTIPEAAANLIAYLESMTLLELPRFEAPPEAATAVPVVTKDSSPPPAN